jgi:hypothetical protein
MYFSRGSEAGKYIILRVAFQKNYKGHSFMAFDHHSYEVKMFAFPVDMLISESARKAAVDFGMTPDTSLPYYFASTSQYPNEELVEIPGDLTWEDIVGNLNYYQIVKDFALLTLNWKE